MKGMKNCYKSFVRGRLTKNKLNTDDYHLIWLTATKNEADQYADSTNSIYEVDLPNDSMIISDIGTDGVLIASSTDPLAKL